MIVLDASALLELLLGTSAGRAIADRIEDETLGVHVPHLVDLEVVQVLRRQVREGALRATDAGTAIEELQLLDLERHDHVPLLARVWALRANVSAYDAVYLALAEGLRAPLVTCDARLAKAPGHRATVELVQ